MNGVSVLVLTHDDEENLPNCLESVLWSDDVHVIDAGGTDRTLEIARRLGAQVLVHPSENGSAQCQWALRNARFRYEWILLLEPEERTPSDVAEEILGAVAQTSPEIAGFEIRRKLYFLGCWLKHAGQFEHSWVLRLVRCQVAQSKETNARQDLQVEGNVRRLKGSLLCENRKPLGDQIDKANRDSTLEAEETYWGRRQPQFPLRLPFRGGRKFLYLFIWRRGFLDGVPGLLFCLLMAAREFLVSLKLGALKRNLPVR